MRKIFFPIALFICISLFYSSCSISPSTSNVYEKQIKTATQTSSFLNDIYPSSETQVHEVLSYPLENEYSQDKNNTLIKEVEEPAKGEASINGLLVIEASNVILKNTRVILTPAQEIKGEYKPPEILTSGFSELGDYVGFANEQGVIEIFNIRPGHYFLFINFPDETLIATRDGKTLLISLEKDKKYLLGRIEMK
ncbi:MAG: hypothetical protein VB108_09105 [Anaerolineaceae bacterium]|nr:hypothetical protein [Anaerolineaceae bacterium]